MKVLIEITVESNLALKGSCDFERPAGHVMKYSSGIVHLHEIEVRAIENVVKAVIETSNALQGGTR